MENDLKNFFKETTNLEIKTWFQYLMICLAMNFLGDLFIYVVFPRGEILEKMEGYTVFIFFVFIFALIIFIVVSIWDAIWKSIKK